MNYKIKTILERYKFPHNFYVRYSINCCKFYLSLHKNPPLMYREAIEALEFCLINEIDAKLDSHFQRIEVVKDSLCRSAILNTIDLIDNPAYKITACTAVANLSRDIKKTAQCQKILLDMIANLTDLEKIMYGISK